MKNRPSLTLATALLATTALLTACGGGGSTDGAGASGDAPAAGGVNKDAPLFDELPEDIQKAGKIQVGGDIAYAPMEYYDENNEVIGFDKDLTDLISEQIGVEFVWNNAQFDGLITQLKSGRIDVAISGMSDTAERQKEIDFVDYYTAGGVLLVPKGNPAGLTGIADLCGKTIAVQRGTMAEDVSNAQSETCQAEGKEAVNVLAFDRETEAMLQVKNGRADSGMQDYPVAAYNARTSGGGNDFEVVGDQVEAGPLGIGVNKEDTELRDTLQKAIQAIIDSGDYQKLIDKYEVPLGAIDEATINAGT
ncbi:ABC transporter substrate-binding protein [Ornithinimicrobium panacihumi]|uniref:ABC transporter substrate-binding protein n=1 Tax=Ornithinimicrobium panacihumi TaxID=2008449 RepID=UPI003F8BA42E